MEKKERKSNLMEKGSKRNNSVVGAKKTKVKKVSIETGPDKLKKFQRSRVSFPGKGTTVWESTERAIEHVCHRHREGSRKGTGS